VLIDDSLGIASNQSELDKMLKQFPEYNHWYVCLATRADWEQERQWFENMWKEYQQKELCAENNFPSELKIHFSQRAWELYLGITLLNRGYTLQKHKSIGPDFKIIHNDFNKDIQTVWIEAISVKKGQPPDAVPEMPFGVSDLPEEQMLLRLTNGLSEKYDKYCKDVKVGVVGADDPYIIAINRSEIEYLDPQIPLILKCLFNLGYQVLFTKPKKPHLKATESFWTERVQVTIQVGIAQVVRIGV
jgi:hypothetical protein